MARTTFIQWLKSLIQWLAHYWSLTTQAMRTLYMIRLPLLMGLIGALALLTDQGQDILRSIAESRYWTNAAIFAAATQLCGLVIWHVARTLFRFCIAYEPIHKLAPKVVAWAPRLLGAGVPGLILIAGILAIFIKPEAPSGQHRWLLVLLLGFASCFNLIFTWQRRQLARHFKLPAVFSTSMSIDEELNTFRNGATRHMAPVSVYFYFILFWFTPISIFWVYSTGGQLPDWLGSGTMTMLALVLATVFGSILTYVAMRLRLPIFAITLVVATLFSANELNNNHHIRLIENNHRQNTEWHNTPQQGETDQTTVQSLLRQRFDLPPRTTQEAPKPVIFVAASGGGIRAAYWTAYSLSRLADESALFRQRLFAISGVSGGSVGAAAYSAIQWEAATRSGTIEHSEVAATTDFAVKTSSLLGGDLLTPILSTFFFTDMAQRFIPFTLFHNDRAAAGELALEAFWRQTYSHRQDIDNPFSLPVRALTPTPNGPVPYLILNSTDLPSGQRVLIHNMPTPLTRRFAFVEPDTDFGEKTPLSTAAFLSARFPYITPSGIYHPQTDASPSNQPRQLRLGDGGYFENSGALSILELIETIDDYFDGNWLPIVIQIDNDPKMTMNLNQEPPGMINTTPPLGQSLDPVRGLMAVRSGHGYRASEALRKWITGRGENNTEADYCDATNVNADNPKGHYFHLRLFKHFEDDKGERRKSNAMPLGWLLSDQARVEIEKQYNDRRNQCEIDRLLALLDS